MQPSPSHFELSNYNVQEYILHEYFFFAQFYKSVATFKFQTFCPVGVAIAQMIVQFAHFQVWARKGGVLG